eukprot:m.203397 g.203397  ORF g.203397 m.203397 type:complete len:102 (+) comp21977_c11_seq1:1603-1908(+)
MGWTAPALASAPHVLNFFQSSATRFSWKASPPQQPRAAMAAFAVTTITTTTTTTTIAGGAGASSLNVSCTNPFAEPAPVFSSNNPFSGPISPTKDCVNPFA